MLGTQGEIKGKNFMRNWQNLEEGMNGRGG